MKWITVKQDYLTATGKLTAGERLYRDDETAIALRNDGVADIEGESPTQRQTQSITLQIDNGMIGVSSNG